MRKLIIMIFLFVIPLSFYAQDRLSRSYWVRRKDSGW